MNVAACVACLCVFPCSVAFGPAQGLQDCVSVSGAHRLLVSFGLDLKGLEGCCKVSEWKALHEHNQELRAVTAVCIQLVMGSIASLPVAWSMKAACRM